MVKDLTPKKKSQKELILAAIELLKVKGLDINPYTVADEAGIARSALYRSTEYMDLLKESRGEMVDGKDTSTRSLHDRIHEMTERARELEETIWNLEAENEKLTKEKQEAWNEGFQAGREDTVRRLAASREAELQLEANLQATAQPSGQNETSPLTPVLEAQVEAAAATQTAVTAEPALQSQSEPIDMSPAGELTMTETADPNQFQTGEIKIVVNPLQAPGAHVNGETPFQATHTPQDDRISAMAMQQLAREPAPTTNPIITVVSPSAPEGVFNAARSGPRVASNFNPLVELSWRDVETVYNYDAESLKGIASQIPASVPETPTQAAEPSPEPEASPVGWQDPSSAQILPPEPPPGTPAGAAGKKASPQAVEAYKQFAYNNYGTEEDGGEAIFSGEELGSRISDPLFPSDESLTRFEPELEPTFEQTAKWEQPSQIPIEAQSHEAIQSAGQASGTEQPQMRILDAAAQAALSPEALQHYQVWANQHQPQYRETTSYRTGEHQSFDQSAYPAPKTPKKQSYLDLGEPEEEVQPAPQSSLPTGEQLHQEVHAGAFQGATPPPPPPYGQDPYGNAPQQAYGQDPYSGSNALNQDLYQPQGYAAASQQYQYGTQPATPAAQEPPYDPYQAYDPYQQQAFDENEARMRGRKTGDKLQAFGDPRDLSNSDPVVDLDALDIFDDLDDYMDVDKIDVIPDVESDQQEEEEELKTAGDELRELIKGRIKQAADIPADAAQRLTGSHAGNANAEKPVGGMGARNKFVGGKAQQTTMEPGANPPTAAPAGFMPKMPPEMRKHLLILGLSVDPESLTKEKVLVAWKNQIAYAHPDLGGDTESAVALNAAKEALVKWVEAQGPKLGKKFGKPGPQGGTMPPQGGTMPPQNPS